MSVIGFTAADVPDQSGRTFFVTGANAGIGKELSRLLARRGARVLMGCRSRTKAEAARDEILRDVSGADVAIVDLDLADLGSVARAAQTVVGEARLDVLLNNAGVMIPPLERTADGFELQFGVNHLGTFALTGQLLGKLAETAGSRVVITSSIAHRTGRIDFDDLNADKGYSRWPRYAQSKLANLMHTIELARRLAAREHPVIAIGCHPGVAQSELMRHMPAPMRIFSPLTGAMFNTSAQGAWAGLAAATAPGVPNGDYLGPTSMLEMSGKVGRAKAEAHARDREVARRLWDVSEEMTGVRYLSG
ncbi:MAG: oxidoreductase [Pseudomonadota bacterium]